MRSTAKRRLIEKRPFRFRKDDKSDKPRDQKTTQIRAPARINTACKSCSEQRMVTGMILKDFLISAGTEKNLMELILFLSTQAQEVKKDFFDNCMKTQADEQTRNIYGEEQMALDKLADGIFISGLKKSRLVRYIATEEQEQLITIDNPKNNFGVVIDPLDGSSLIDVNLCIGSIIGIYPGHVLEKGAKMIAALYILYGPLTTPDLNYGKGSS